MSVYQEAGLLILGTRLKRISDRFLNEVSKVYKKQGIRFETAWFPVLFLLDSKGPMSLTKISNELEVSHSAISQMINQLQEKAIVDIRPDDSDARIRQISLTVKGRELIDQAHPVWHALSKSLNRILPHNTDQPGFLDLLSFIEKQLNDHILSETTLTYLNQEPGDIIITEPESDSRERLVRWLNQEGVVFIPSDESLLVALSEDNIIGMTAFRPEKDCIILDHLYVTPLQRRKGVGLKLVQNIFQKCNAGPSGWFQLNESNIDLIKVLVKSGFSFKVKQY
ncbi:MAG: bifunctional helix-turn-helix transcriptional regulator/GNAT family N-acetyltransferase [Bacteroidales bacterium]|nr:bifunctional helix-turn-helix transcriptional regulator/GNAT family N-acetyltransferase [Bacteroidales bacterium]